MGQEEVGLGGQTRYEGCYDLLLFPTGRDSTRVCGVFGNRRTVTNQEEK